MEISRWSVPLRVQELVDGACLLVAEGGVEPRPTAVGAQVPRFRQDAQLPVMGTMEAVVEYMPV